MNQLVLTNANQNQPFYTAEITVLNKLSEKANNLVSGVNKFLHAPFRAAKKENDGKVNETTLQPESKSIMENATPVCSNDFKFEGTFREKICVESKLKELVGSLSTAITGNFNQFKIVESGDHFVSANRKALSVALKNMLYFINERNHHQQVRLEVFEDIDYTVIVAKHEGMGLRRSELMKIYQAPPSLITDFGNTLLYTSWHLLKAIGGWLTSGDNGGTTYISIGLPK